MNATQDYLNSLDWRMMPEDAGQGVDYTYAVDVQGLWERRHDRGDGSVSYRFTRFDMRASEDRLRFEPWNSRLPAHSKRWRKVRVC